ncbi:mitochondrial import inner membrane translocase subunit Tim17/Tim22/Tim23 family protein [Wolffia australiana]
MSSEGTAAELPSASGEEDANWKERILVPAVLGGLIGAGGGLLSKHRKVLGTANVCATYAANAAIVAGSYSGVREFVKNTRATEPNDLVNSAIGGFATGALLGRLQGGQRGALRYSIIFAVVGPVFDLATNRLYPLVRDISPSTWQLPDWSPIKVLDEDALAAKRAREQKLYAQRTLGEDLIKEEPR